MFEKPTQKTEESSGEPVKIREDIKSVAVTSGIGQRMLDRIAAQNNNRPLTEGTTPNDCDFELEIQPDHRSSHRNEISHVLIAIEYPSSTHEGLGSRAFSAGDVDRDGTVEFSPSFGAASDAPLDENQKQIIQELVTEALSKKDGNN